MSTSLLHQFRSFLASPLARDGLLAARAREPALADTATPADLIDAPLDAVIAAAGADPGATTLATVVLVLVLGASLRRTMARWRVDADDAMPELASAVLEYLLGDDRATSYAVLRARVAAHLDRARRRSQRGDRRASAEVDELPGAGSDPVARIEVARVCELGDVRLPVIDREILVAHVAGDSHVEIAARLRLTPAASRLRLSRARQRLREAVVEPTNPRKSGR